jgi:phage-related protein
LASDFVSSGEYAYVECDDVTVNLDSSNTPTATIGAEQGNYELACTITNETTGDAIQLNFSMELNEELEVDTDEKEVVYLANNSRQMQALTLVGGVRREWLPLQPGNNTLRFDDTGTTGVTVTITFEKRYY